MDSSVESKETPKEYKTTKINNRRYLGNKYKLLPFITRVVENECKNINTLAEITYVILHGLVVNIIQKRKL